MLRYYGYTSVYYNTTEPKNASINQFPMAPTLRQLASVVNKGVK